MQRHRASLSRWVQSLRGHEEGATLGVVLHPELEHARAEA